MTPSPKIQPRHQRLQAIVYVRQSTPKQVHCNQESTRRQYQLAERARQMGWAPSQVLVIDEDLGLSGAGSRQRTGFQRLVAAIGLGEVGLVLVTEVSRLSRCNSDWRKTRACPTSHIKKCVAEGRGAKPTASRLATRVALSSDTRASVCVKCETSSRATIPTACAIALTFHVGRTLPNVAITSAAPTA